MWKDSRSLWFLTNLFCSGVPAHADVPKRTLACRHVPFRQLSKGVLRTFTVGEHMGCSFIVACLWKFPVATQRRFTVNIRKNRPLGNAIISCVISWDQWSRIIFFVCINPPACTRMRYTPLGTGCRVSSLPSHSTEAKPANRDLSSNNLTRRPRRSKISNLT